MRILVTGGAGFIGSHVVDAYVSARHQVTVVDNLVSGNVKNLNRRARFVKADVREKEMERVFKFGRFDVINHLAAQIDVRRSVENPVFDADVNILGLLNVLELSRKSRVKKIIFSASGGTYYGECVRPARETDLPRPLSPYGISKLASEFYLRAYRSLHSLPFTVLRYGNVYGPRQDPHGEAGVVAIFCQRLLAGTPVSIYGTGKQQRDYVFVSDVAQANVAALSRGEGESINIGTGRASDVNRLYEILSSCHPAKSTFERKPARPGELFRSVLHVSKAARVLGWTPRVSLKDGLAETYRYIAAQTQ